MNIMNKRGIVKVVNNCSVKNFKLQKYIEASHPFVWIAVGIFAKNAEKKNGVIMVSVMAFPKPCVLSHLLLYFESLHSKQYRPSSDSSI